MCRLGEQWLHVERPMTNLTWMILPSRFAIDCRPNGLNRPVNYIRVLHWLASYVDFEHTVKTAQCPLGSFRTFDNWASGRRGIKFLLWVACLSLGVRPVVEARVTEGSMVSKPIWAILNTTRWWVYFERWLWAYECKNTEHNKEFWSAGLRLEHISTQREHPF
jgi:hypothetical protein